MPVDFSFTPILPELILALGAMVLLLVGVFVGERRSVGLITVLSVVLIVAAAVAVVWIPDRYVTFNGAFTFDAFARAMKLLTLLGSAAAVVMAARHAAAERYARFEFPLLIVVATLGMLVMISASD